MMEGQGKKEIEHLLPSLKEHDQLQTSGISKRFDAQRRDCAQIVDILKKIKMLINFVYLTEGEIEISLVKGAAKHISQIVQRFDDESKNDKW